MNEPASPPNLGAQIEALLFALGKPLSRADLCHMLECSSSALEDALHRLRQDADSRGVALVDDGQTLELRVAPQSATFIEQIQKEEYSKEIGRAGMEVLAAILYRGPLTRSEIDFIRGVNSSQTLRTLTMRGLVRKSQTKTSAASGARAASFPYEPTTELLATLGVTHISDLPEYTAVRDKLTALEAAYRATNTENA